MYKYPGKTPIHVFNGTKRFEQFGYSFDLSTISEKNMMIAIGSATKQVMLDKSILQTKLTNGGMVQVFDLGGNFSARAVLKSDRSFAEFGSKVKFFPNNEQNSDDLFISAQKRSKASFLKGK